ncbi:hypothetical protein U14_02655 [Candidatus Moduliflexus flocculans]|uniref:Glycosyltransferase RgtA/B/C/D-like domain-containing protein n=1 Tax=Candidatus Moduliflexus flocculans TaxID=1499966 RepID=A0A081BLZ5_9BACT|nr:hypothetical protein U14_02655 [Candidatus Moduliflexus flocculans]
MNNNLLHPTLARINNTLIPWGITGGFITLCFINILRHEMWRDELQAWLIAMKSDTLAELFQNSLYEGHPKLWFLLLFALTRITHSLFLMQVLHLLIATATVFLFTAYSPFSRLQKTLFPLGYFPLYEYGTISRNYSIGILLIILFCVVYQKRQSHYWLLSGFLFLLCQTNAPALLLSIVLSGFLFVDNFFPFTKSKIAMFGFLLFGVLLAVITTNPPHDSGFAFSWNRTFDSWRLREVISLVWKSYVPLPQPSLHFWNTNIVTSLNVQTILSFILLAICSGYFFRFPTIFLLYGFGTLTILLFSYMKYLGSIRHHGHLFFLFVVALWLSLLKQSHSSLPRTISLQFISIVFTVLLAIHAFAGIFASMTDWIYPFSKGKHVAQFLQQGGWDKFCLIGDQDFAASTVAGYLYKDIYYYGTNRIGTFIIWDRNWYKYGGHNTTSDALLETVNRLPSNCQNSAIFVLNYPLFLSPSRTVNLGNFLVSIVSDEQYYLYLYSNTFSESRRSTKSHEFFIPPMPRSGLATHAIQ